MKCSRRSADAHGRKWTDTIHCRGRKGGFLAYSFRTRTDREGRLRVDSGCLTGRVSSVRFAALAAAAWSQICRVLPCHGKETTLPAGSGMTLTGNINRLEIGVNLEGCACVFTLYRFLARLDREAGVSLYLPPKAAVISHDRGTLMRALLFLFASSLALASAQAGELTKQGEESSTLYMVGLPGTGEMVGIKRTDNGDAMFDKMGVRTTESGDRRETVLIDDDGDQIFSTFELGTFRYVRRTGKYAGISGEGTFTCDRVRALGSESLVICRNKSRWKLP